VLFCKSSQSEGNGIGFSMADHTWRTFFFPFTNIWLYYQKEACHFFLCYLTLPVLAYRILRGSVDFEDISLLEYDRVRQ
jgi:hypothetical protein